MKIFLSSFLILFATSSAFAYTTNDTFECFTGDKITVTSSLMPNGSRYTKATLSTIDEELNEIDCKKVEQNFQSSGSENCLTNEKQTVLFTHFKKFGMLRVKTRNKVNFAPCNQTESIQ